MIPYAVYKVFHILGVALLCASIGAAIMEQLREGARDETSGDDPAAARIRRFIAISHGVGLVFIVVSGFGLVAKLHLPYSAWMIGKLVIWVLLGASLTLVRHVRGRTKLLWVSLPLLVAIAQYLAVLRPGW